jgi:tRNA 2-thiouridine synthesizing protein C
MKNFSPTYRALGDYDIKKLYVEQESLDERGLNSDDLMEITYENEDEDFAEKPSIRIVSRSELTEIMAQQDVLLNF